MIIVHKITKNVLLSFCVLSSEFYNIPSGKTVC